MLQITDLIIQNSNGIPYLARCFGSDFCRNYADHTLLSGFFAAINAFTEELQQEALTIVGFDGLYVLIETREELMVILSTEKKENENEVRTLAKEVRDEFLTLYFDKRDDLERNNTDFSDFVVWIEQKIEKTVGDIDQILNKRSRKIRSRIRKFFGFN